MCVWYLTAAYHRIQGTCDTMQNTTVPTSDLLTFLVEHNWCMGALPSTLRRFTERQLRGAWARIQTSVPTMAATSDHVRIALLIARGV